MNGRLVVDKSRVVHRSDKCAELFAGVRYLIPDNGVAVRGYAVCAECADDLATT